MNESIALLINQISDNFIFFLMMEARVASTFSVIFFLRREWVSGKILIGLSLALGLFLLQTSKNIGLIVSDDSYSLFILLLNQLILGLSTGILINLFAEIFIGFGQIVSMQAGLGFVNFYVPRVGHITPLTQFIFLIAITIFLGLNGHLILIKMMMTSLISMPTLPHTLDTSSFINVIQFSGIIFKGSVMLSVAVIFSILVTNLTLAILTKFSPQLNLFSIGINISLIICFFFIYICFDLIIENGTILFNELMTFVKQTIK